MALTCARCATQNPDGNAFCQACGTQLVAMQQAPPAGPPPSAPPPNWAPPGPPPPSAQPAPPAASWLPPQGAPPSVAVPPPGAPPPSYQSPYYAPPPGFPQPPVHRTPWLLIISAIVGLVLLMAGCGTALAMINARNQPGSTVGSDLPSPTPAGTPSPVGTQTPSKGGANPASTSSVSATVPPGWVATTKDPVLQVTNPAGTGTIVMWSGSQTAQYAQQEKD